MKYKRFYIPGGTYFFTIVTCNRTSIFSEHANIELFKSACRHIKQQYPFTIVAYCILLNHIHMIWTLPQTETDYSTRWRLIKGHFTRNLQEKPVNAISRSRVSKNEQSVWQRRFWEHYIRDDNDLTRHIEYIHYNPVKHGLVKTPIDWPHSSFKDYVQKGLYSPSWGSENIPDFKINPSAE